MANDPERDDLHHHDQQQLGGSNDDHTTNQRPVPAPARRHKYQPAAPETPIVIGSGGPINVSAAVGGEPDVYHTVPIYDPGETSSSGRAGPDAAAQPYIAEASVGPDIYQALFYADSSAVPAAAEPPFVSGSMRPLIPPAVLAEPHVPASNVDAPSTTTDAGLHDSYSRLPGAPSEITPASNVSAPSRANCCFNFCGEFFSHICQFCCDSVWFRWIPSSCVTPCCRGCCRSVLRVAQGTKWKWIQNLLQLICCCSCCTRDRSRPVQRADNAGLEEQGRAEEIQMTDQTVQDTDKLGARDTRREEIYQGKRSVNPFTIVNTDSEEEAEEDHLLVRRSRRPARVIEETSSAVISQVQKSEEKEESAAASKFEFHADDNTEGIKVRSQYIGRYLGLAIHD